MTLLSAERTVSVHAGIVREFRPGVELDALEHGKNEQCLDEIHPDLPEPLGCLKLDRNLIGPTLSIKLDAAAQYTIRAFNPNRRTNNELPVGSPSAHTNFLSVASASATVAEAGGATIPARGGAA